MQDRGRGPRTAVDRAASTPPARNTMRSRSHPNAHKARNTEQKKHRVTPRNRRAAESQRVSRCSRFNSAIDLCFQAQRSPHQCHNNEANHNLEAELLGTGQRVFVRTEPFRNIAPGIYAIRFYDNGRRVYDTYISIGCEVCSPMIVFPRDLAIVSEYVPPAPQPIRPGRHSCPPPLRPEVCKPLRI